MSERTTVRLPEDLVRRAKGRAAAEGRSLTALIEESVRRILNEKFPRKKTERVLPPISAKTGGLMPGIDLNDSAMLQEMEDMGRIR